MTRAEDKDSSIDYCYWIMNLQGGSDGGQPAQILDTVHIIHPDLHTLTFCLRYIKHTLLPASELNVGVGKFVKYQQNCWRN